MKIAEAGVTRARLLSCLGAALLFQAAASAIPPPPPSPQHEAALSAIERLSPFLGRWTGIQTLPGPYGRDPALYFRDARRIGDVIVLVEGVANQTLTVNAIDFDPISGSYRLFRPGFRHPVDLDRDPVT